MRENDGQGKSKWKKVKQELLPMIKLNLTMVNSWRYLLCYLYKLEEANLGIL